MEAAPLMEQEEIRPTPNRVGSIRSSNRRLMIAGIGGALLWVGSILKEPATETIVDRLPASTKAAITSVIPDELLQIPKAEANDCEKFNDVLDQKVDLVEVNHFYDEQGSLNFDQVIYYEWCDYVCRYQVVAWRLIKSEKQKPIRDWKTNEYKSIWNDNGTLRHVRAAASRESWTQYDPELLERHIFPMEHRRELYVPKKEPKPFTYRGVPVRLPENNVEVEEPPAPETPKEQPGHIGFGRFGPFGAFPAPVPPPIVIP